MKNSANATLQIIGYEEVANSVTHWAGTLLSVVGLTLLIVFANLYGTGLHVFSCSVFGVTLVLLYASSSLYHSVWNPHLKHVLKIVDHACIYLLIAGTYTPLTLITLRGNWGWTIFCVVWALAAAGIVFQVFFVYRFKILATLAYILMGWIAIIAIKPLIAQFPLGGLIWLISGGLAYTVGTIFYLWKRLPYSHAIWHLFVLGGSICHFFAVFLYVIPVKTLH